MRLSQMKLGFSLYASLIGLGMIPSSVSLAQSGWTRQTSGTFLNFHGVSFVDANTGTAVGEAGTILRTTTGGVDRPGIKTFEPRNAFPR